MISVSLILCGARDKELPFEKTLIMMKRHLIEQIKKSPSFKVRE
ncbi:hypothetical protein XIS1_1110046 [Xenorhabdus innexi]|uniref:Uncharacterized protein n=1 Tax=Xenorhabdus innexi TaxID=290109 RepID=A0A1N6MR94_9GAMM|nr:hypothetical protein XIS1_1110046 [Xenorhabdus innexi]